MWRRRKWKTIVGIISAYITYLSGYQTALMAPTEILATQHYENVKNYYQIQTLI